MNLVWLVSDLHQISFLRFISNRVSVSLETIHPMLSACIGSKLFVRLVYRCILVTKSEESPCQHMTWGLKCLDLIVYVLW
jgi:hypothetical protein